MPSEIQPEDARRLDGADDRLREANEQLTLATLRAQEQLDESEQSYRDLVEGLDAIVWEANADPWQFTFVSQQAEAILGHPVERWLTEPTLWMDLMHPEDRPLVVSACRAGAAARQDFRVEYRAIALDGRIVWLAMIARLRRNEHRPAQFRGLLIDVGDSIRAERLQKLVAQQTAELLAKQDQLRALATELTLAEHRERARLAADLHDYLAQLLAVGRLKLAHAKRANPAECAGIIKETEDLLSESLAYVGTLVADLRPPVLQEFGLVAALHWLAGKMQRYYLKVVIESPESLELSIPEDRAVLLFQSVRELLINISKHAATGRATVSLQCDNAVLRIAVRDEGQGFDLAAAAAAVNSPVGTSSKFGLFSIRERMKALGGEFELDSAPGKGTTALLRLPLP